jgi:hypothetical protein
MKSKLHETQNNIIVKSKKSQEKSKLETKKMKITLFSGKEKDMTSEEIKKQKEMMLTKRPEKEMKSPYQIVGFAVQLMRKMMQNSIDVFIKSIITDKENFTQGCVYDNKEF